MDLRKVIRKYRKEIEDQLYADLGYELFDYAEVEDHVYKLKILVYRKEVVRSCRQKKN